MAIIISRPEPRRLLIAFYVGGLLTSITTGIIVLAVFKNNEAVLGSTKSAPNPVVSIIVGAVALVFAWLMTSVRGSAVLDHWRSRHGRKAEPDKGPSWAERRLGGASWKIALLIGAVINLPGPFYLLALGKIAHGGYATPAQIALVLMFNAIMLVMLEVPLVGYLFRPETTAKRVAAMSRLLNRNGLRITGWLVAVLGLSLIGQGIAALVS